MGDDATLPPSPARIRRAWAAGRRPSSMWLPTGIALLGLAALVAVSPPDATLVLARTRDALARGGEGAGEIALEAVTTLLVGAASVIALVIAALVIAGLLQGRLGPIDPALEDRLGAPRPPTAAVLGIVLAAVLLVVVGADVMEVAVGGARAADASEAALAELWHGGALRVLVTLGLAASAIGIVESWWSRRAELIALATTPTQARDEAREARGRRR
jgi:hypothetical protein